MKAESRQIPQKLFRKAKVCLLSLDIRENKWYHLIDAQINIQNMILPHVK